MVWYLNDFKPDDIPISQKKLKECRFKGPFATFSVWEGKERKNIKWGDNGIHKDLGARGCAENLGLGYNTLTKWLKDFRESGDISVRGSGNYATNEQEAIAYLRRELRDAQDTLDETNS